VNVGGQTLKAPLAPQVYSELPVDKITRIETAFANSQKVQVVLPDGSIAEGQITGIKQGEKLIVSMTTDQAQGLRQTDIYSALDVGEAVVRNNGHTEPVRKQVYAVLGILVGIAAVWTMTWERRKLDDEVYPRLYRWLYRGRILIGIAVLLMFLYLLSAAQLNQHAAAGIGALTEDQFKLAYEFATGAKPPAVMRAEALKAELLYWPQVFSVMVGAVMIGMAYLVWQSAQRRETPAGFGITILLAVLMMVGGWLLMGELPRTLALGGRETEEAVDALNRTAMYAIGTVPIQLALGLFLAYLLFSEISWGKSLFRVIYFMPYIAPSVATSTVFLVIFRLEPGSLANRVVGLFGMEPQTWLKEPTGVIRLFYANVLGGNPLNIPETLAGPSLALLTVILYNIWVFAGYNAVVFLAGLGAIPGELYEAAEVDGAGRWARFRSITLPLLSPTTFFLSMLSIIGTFKAFTHIYVLRGQATGKEVDTMSVHIFNTLYSANDPGYAAALAFTLFGVILVLTAVQNRLAREQVFYG
jgi:multiple sugar transport system permease protein